MVIETPQPSNLPNDTPRDLRGWMQRVHTLIWKDLHKLATLIGSGPPYSSPTIPEVTSDPASPVAESAWVLYNSAGVTGVPIGMLLGLTGVIPATYRFSYRTLEGSTVRVQLS